MRPVVDFLKKCFVINSAWPEFHLRFFPWLLLSKYWQRWAGKHFSQSANRKSQIGRFLGVLVRKSQIPQIFIINSQIVNPSKNTLQLCLKKVLNYMYTCSCKDNKCGYLRTCGSFKSTERLGPQIANPQVSHLRKVRKSNKVLKPQMWGFAICETYLLTAHLWILDRRWWAWALLLFLLRVSLVIAN